MTDLRGGFTPEVESDSANSTIFKTVAALIVALMLGVVGAYYYFGPSINAPATRVALVTPPAVPLKPVIPPRMVTPSPQASLAPAPTTEAKAADTVAAPSAAPHPRRHVQQAEVQPAPEAPAAVEPAASPTLTAPTPPLPEAPVQPAADPTQPAQ
jgi:hypothetical protein